MESDHQQLIRENYSSISAVVNRIAVRISRRYAGVMSRAELQEELVSYAWLEVILQLDGYDASRGCLITTYLWERLWGRVSRYASKYAQYRMMDEVKATTHAESSTVSDDEDWKNSLCDDPWHNSPEKVWECRERIKLQQRLKRKYAPDYAIFTETTDRIDAKSVSERQRIYRTRRKMLEIFSKVFEKEMNLLQKSEESLRAVSRSGINESVRHAAIKRRGTQRPQARSGSYHVPMVASQTSQFQAVQR